MPAADDVEFARLLISAERMLARDGGAGEINSGGGSAIGADPIFQHVRAP